MAGKLIMFLDFLEKKKVHSVLTWSLDRIGRNMLDVVNNVETFSAKSINVYVKKEGLNTLNEDGKKKAWSA